MIHLYTGEGKGKTTAAIGLCIRAAGRGYSVCFSQFMKGNDTGELYVLEKLTNVEILRSRKNYGFYASMSEADKRELTEVHNDILDSLIERAKSGTCRMIIMDEVTYPVKWGLLDIKRLETLLEMGKEGSDQEVEIIMTGRDAKGILKKTADYITQMECVRHPYERGTTARKGIEF